MLADGHADVPVPEAQFRGASLVLERGVERRARVEAQHRDPHAARHLGRRDVVQTRGVGCQGVTRVLESTASVAATS